MRWTKPEAVEVKMDAEISSYQSDDLDPTRDPLDREAQARLRSRMANDGSRSRRRDAA
jgi:hypothetical protein